ncbi:MAG: hypothetical protein EOO88_49045, partial [Pedobacter sp.]
MIKAFPYAVLFLLTFSEACKSPNRTATAGESSKGKIESGIAAGFKADENIQRDSNVLFASSFNNGFEGWTSFCETCEVVDGSIAKRDSRILKIVAKKHVNTGGDVLLRLAAGEDEIYFRFYTYFPAATVTPHHFVKIISYPIPYYGGHAGKRPPQNKYFVLGIEPTKENKWHFYNYWQEMHSWQTYRGDPDTARGPNSYYGNTFEADQQTAFKRDEWICVEARVKLNDPGDSNGLMAIWINGKKIGEWGKGYPTGTWRGDRYVTSGAENINPT